MGFILGDPVVYWILKTLLLMTLFICGYMISFKDRTGQKYWQYATPAVLFYSLEYGLRWNRSFDFPHYYQDLTGRLYQEYSDPIYLLWIDFFKASGLDASIAFIFYSAILIFAFLLVLKEHRELAFIALPLFMIVPTQADNHIRQFFAFAFIMIGYYYQEKQNKTKSLLLYLMGMGIHLSAIFCVLFILIVKYVPIEKYIKSNWVIVVAYLLFYFLWDSSNLQGFADFLGKYSMGEDVAMQRYLDNADYWLTDESNINDKLGLKTTVSNLYFVILKLVIECGNLYYGYIVIKRNPQYRLAYWSIAFCYFNRVFGGNNEIFSRFNSWLLCFTPFIVAFIVMQYPFKRMIKYLVLFLFVYYYLYVGFISKMFSISLTGYAYIWDK